ncbi:Putative phage-related tail protein [Ralstonia solanacearum CMR15]|nr:Putative phage-related tail protein [Ralstonia solanacearum CMR15]
MIDAYLIGTTIKLNDLVTPGLVKLEARFKAVDALGLQVNKRLQKMGTEVVGVRNLAAASKSLGDSLKVVKDQSALIERNLLAVRGALPHGGLGLEAELIAANAQARTLAATIAGIRGGGRLLPSNNSGAGGHSGSGARRGWHPHGGNLHVGPGGVGLSAVGLGMAGNMLVPLAAAGATIYVGKQLYDSAKDLQTEQARFRLFGLSDTQNKSAYQFAHNMRAYGTSEIQAMHYMNEAQAVFRESGESGENALAGAKMAAPFLAKMMAASSILSEESKAKLQHESLAMLRAVELQGGAKKPEDFAKLADFGFRLTQTSGGQVNWEQIRQMYRTGGVAVQRMGMDTIASLEPLIGEFKGGAFATAMRTAYNRMNGIVKLPNQAVHELMKAGVWDPSKVELNANGGIKRFLGNPLAHADEYAQNPAEYYFKYIKPFYERQGYKDTERDRMNAMFFGSTGGNLFSKIDQQQNVIHGAGEAFRKAVPLDPALDIAKGTASGAEKDFQAAWTDFKKEFGKNVLPAATEMLNDGASILRSIASASEKVKSSSSGQSFADVSKGALSFLAWPYRAMSGSAEAKPIDPVAKKEPSMVQVKTDIKLDSRVIAEATTLHQARELSRPQTGPSTFDSLMSLRPPSLK